MSSRDRLATLLSRVADRDEAAFDELYRATSAKLFGVVVRILHRPGLAEEVLQETYVKVWEHASVFDPSIASPITWMAAIARNRALDEVRRKTTVSLDQAPGLDEIPSEDAHPLEGMELSEDVARLMRCLDGLEAERRELVLLAYRHGLTRDALAERYACPVGTIKTWLRRSLAQLKDCLGS